MNELLLINMMSELNLDLLQNDYIEKDMKRGKISFFKKIFSLKKKSEQPYEFPFEYPQFEDPNLVMNQLGEDSELDNDTMNMEIYNKEELDCDTDEDSNIIDRGFSIRIFEKKFRNLIKIISGITATILVVIGILIILIKRHKGGIKTIKEKVQMLTT